jgi:hypothetical protein
LKGKWRVWARKTLPLSFGIKGLKFTWFALLVPLLSFLLEHCDRPLEFLHFWCSMPKGRNYRPQQKDQPTIICIFQEVLKYSTKFLKILSISFTFEYASLKVLLIGLWKPSWHLRVVSLILAKSNVFEKEENLSNYFLTCAKRGRKVLNLSKGENFKTKNSLTKDKWISKHRKEFELKKRRAKLYYKWSKMLKLLKPILILRIN